MPSAKSPAITVPRIQKRSERRRGFGLGGEIDSRGGCIAGRPAWRQPNPLKKRSSWDEDSQAFPEKQNTHENKRKQERAG